MLKAYIPRDSGALAMGAESVATALAKEAAALGIELSIVRTGSRGMYWLEPLVEVEAPEGRVGYGPVRVADVPELLDGVLNRGGTHRLKVGRPEMIPYFAKQERLNFRRVGVVDPVSLDDYRATGGFRGLVSALGKRGIEIVNEVTESGLRGRGGAAFPTGIKWKTAHDADSAEKYIVCNADEGDSGTFSDRMVMEGDPYSLLEGMTIAGLAIGATKGYIYLRSEYPHARLALEAAIRSTVAGGFLGPNILGSRKSFEIEIRMGAGAYICGEETSLLESLEGKRGMVRYKPPLPAIQGLFGKPTIVNNVITFASVPIILDQGAKYYRDFGMGRSRGTLPLQLAGNIKRGGLVEKAFGITLRELLYEFGGGSRSGRPIRAVQVGGPLGAFLPESQFDTPIDYEAFTAIGGMLGHGGIVAFDDTVQMGQMARYSMEFCAIESCGKCTPCRIGSVRGAEVITKMLQGDRVEEHAELLSDLCDTMVAGSLCALGGMAPFPVMSALKHFPQDFGLPAATPAAVGN